MEKGTVWYNKSENIAIMHYSDLLEELEELIKFKEENEILRKQIDDLKAVIASWEAMMDFTIEVGVEFIDDYISVEEMFADTMPYEYMYKG